MTSITLLYAGILGLLYFRVSIETIKARKRNQISLGYGPNNEIAAIVSAHDNFKAYVPMLLALLYALEMSGATHALLIHALGLAIVAGRVLHFISFRGEKMQFKQRRWGMYLTLWPLIVLSALNIFAFIRGLV